MRVFQAAHFTKFPDALLGRSKCCGKVRTMWDGCVEVSRVRLVESASSDVIPQVAAPGFVNVGICRTFYFPSDLF